MGIRICKTN